MSRPSVSLVINTLNAAADLPDCLASCPWADEIVVVDMHSTDRTREIATAAGARVLLTEPRGYVEPARNFALSQARCDWILLLDADERLHGSEEDVAALMRSAGPDVAAYQLKRVNHLGRWTIRDSGWGDDPQVRLLRRGAAEWSDVIHAKPRLTGRLLSAPVDGPVWIEHFNFTDLAHFATKLTRYAAKEPAPPPVDWRELMTELHGEFARRYTPGQDGALSLVLALQLMQYRLMVHAFDWERGAPMPELPDADALADWFVQLNPGAARQRNAWQQQLARAREQCASLEQAMGEIRGRQRDSEYQLAHAQARLRQARDPLLAFHHAWHVAREAALPRGRRFHRHGVKWELSSVTQTGAFLRLAGRIRDIDGRAPRCVFARLGRRTLHARLSPPDAEGFHPFEFSFTSRRPGWKFIGVHAGIAHGDTLTLGYRLARQRIGTHPAGPRSRTAAHSTTTPEPQAIALPPPGPEPQVSIVIPIYNQVPLTLRCLDSIARETAGIDYEVIVVDDCSPDPAVNQLAAVPHLRVHRNATNLGFVRSCNAGAHLARGTHLVFLNNDTLVTPGWLAALRSTFAERPDAGLVGAKLVYPDGTLQEAGGIVWRDASGWNYGRGEDPRRPEFNYLKPVDYCSGACVMIARDFFAALGGFDELYVPAYYEDTDLAFRVRRAGRQVYYQPRCEIVHFEGQSNGTDTAGTGVKRYQTLNRAKFEERWRAVLQTEQQEDPAALFRARDRSGGRPVVLVIDHYVPQPDHDAGSRCIEHLIDFLLGAGFNVKFFPDNHAYDPHYTPRLEDKGVEVIDERLPGGFHLADWLAAHGRELAYVFFSRAHISAPHLPLPAGATSARVLFLGHDLLSRSFTRAYQLTGESESARLAAEWRRWEEGVFPHVHAVYYPSPLEVEELHRVHPQLRARVLPLLTYPTPAEPPPDAAALAGRQALLFVGGFRHRPNLEGILGFLRDSWPEIAAAHPEIVLHIAGSQTPPELHACAGERVRVHGYVSDTRLAELYREARMVIAPLRNGGGVKGKVLEALWHGVPVLTTPIGAEGIPEAGHAFAVAEIPDFAATLLRLYGNPARLAAQALAGHAALARHFSTAAYREALAEDMPELRRP